MAHDQATGKEFKFVYIPASSDDDIQELSEQEEEGQEVECLLNRCKEHFKRVSAENETTSKEQQRQELMKQMPQGSKVDDKLMDTMGDMLLVETVALQSGSKENGYTHVNMYVDDRGALKGLPHNKRATEMARWAGLETDIRGDAFMGRVIDDGERFERRDFSKSECNSDAEWFQAARDSAARRRNNQGGLKDFAENAQVVNMGDHAQQAQPGSEAKPIQEEGGKYSWYQDDEEIFIDIPCPKETKVRGRRKIKNQLKGIKGKDVRVKVDTHTIDIGLLKGGHIETVVQGALSQRVHPDECHWSMSTEGDEKKVTVTLTKAGDKRWSSLLSA